MPVSALMPDAILLNGVVHMLSGPAKMLAPDPTIGNSAKENFEKPEVGITAGLLVTMFHNESFHMHIRRCHCWSPVCSFDSPYLV